MQGTPCTKYAELEPIAEIGNARSVAVLGSPRRRLGKLFIAASVALLVGAALGIVASRGFRIYPSTQRTELSSDGGLPTIQRSEDGSNKCSDRFVAPEKPKTPSDHNGVALQEVCYEGEGPFHVFIIGDWGAIWEEGKPKAASHLSHRWGQAYKFVWPVDESAQPLIADQMKKLAKHSKPDYVLNVGDNFYWAGVEDHCGAKDISDLYSMGGTQVHKSPKHKANQFKVLFEEMYDGPDLAGKQWLGVLGNHDYGGWLMSNAWDQAVGYTWTRGGSATGRWMTPALYWSVKVNYPDFSVDYWFMDTNVWDGLSPHDTSTHNICGQAHNHAGASCPGGPKSIWECPKWFKKLWSDQKKWLLDLCPKSKADWRIVVTHFPPYWGKRQWKRLSEDCELDLIVTGHRHSQFMRHKDDEKILIWPEWGKKAALKEGYTDFLDPTAWVVSGGGGGVTSEHVPMANGSDDQYGFMDMTLSREQITVAMISHGGEHRRKIHIKHHYIHRKTETTVTTPTTQTTETTTTKKTTTEEITTTTTTEKVVDDRPAAKGWFPWR